MRRTHHAKHATLTEDEAKAQEHQDAQHVQAGGDEDAREGALLLGAPNRPRQRTHPWHLELRTGRVPIRGLVHLSGQGVVTEQR